MTMSISTTRAFMCTGGAALLQNQELCDFLKNIDEVERIQITAEEKPFNDEMDALNEKFSWKRMLRDSAYAAIGVGGAFALGKYGFDHSKWAMLEFDELGMQAAAARFAERSHIRSKPTAEMLKEVQAYKDWWVKTYNDAEKERLEQSPKDAAKWFIGAAAVTGAAVFSLEYLSYYKKKEALVNRYTSGINDARYLRLLDKVRKVEQRLAHANDELESQQLPIAKDYFSKKHLDMNVDLKNTLKVEHKHVYNRW